MKLVSESFRYEGTELGKCSPVGEALKSFFAHLFGALSKEQKGDSYLKNLNMCLI